MIGGVEALGQFAEFGGRGAEGVGGVAPDFGDNFVIDVGGDAAEILFDVRGGVAKAGLKRFGGGSGGHVCAPDSFVDTDVLLLKEYAWSAASA
jgi:hypothetical protein